MKDKYIFTFLILLIIVFSTIFIYNRSIKNLILITDTFHTSEIVFNEYRKLYETCNGSNCAPRDAYSVVKDCDFNAATGITSCKQSYYINRFVHWKTFATEYEGMVVRSDLSSFIERVVADNHTCGKTPQIGCKSFSGYVLKFFGSNGFTTCKIEQNVNKYTWRMC